MYAHLGRKTEILGHVFYDFYKSPLDMMIHDEKQSTDPVIGDRNSAIKSKLK